MRSGHTERAIGRALAAALLVAGLVPVCAAAVVVGMVHPSSGHVGAQSEEGYLGISFHDVSGDEAVALHLNSPRGAEVAMVDHDGPAGKAGLQPRDIITELNGQVVDGAVALKRMIHEAGANVGIALAVLRDGHMVTVHARLANRADVERAAMERLESAAPAQGTEVVVQGFAAYTAPVPAAAPSSRTQSLLSSMLHVSPFTGLVLDAMGPQLSAFFGAPEGVGLLVHTVAADSPAAGCGLRAGDVVERADGEALHSVSDWTHHLKAAKGRPLTLVVLRDKHERTVTLTPDLKRHSSVVLPGLPGAVTVDLLA
jgi:serine protease Do